MTDAYLGEGGGWRESQRTPRVIRATGVHATYSTVAGNGAADGWGGHACHGRVVRPLPRRMRRCHHRWIRQSIREIGCEFGNPSVLAE